MPPLEVERSRKIANARIHTERVISNIQKKFSLLNSQLPINFLMKMIMHSIPLLIRLLQSVVHYVTSVILLYHLTKVQQNY